MSRHHLPIWTVALFGLGLTATPSPALSMAPPAPPAKRPFLVPIVVVGTVDSIETDTVQAEPFPNAPKPVAFRVAVVKINKNLKGGDGLTHIRVGFIPPPPPPPPQPRQPRVPAAGGQPVFVQPRLPMAPPGPQLQEKQVVCLFLAKHPKENFCVFRYDCPPLYSVNGGYQNDLDTIQKALAVTANPLPALTARNAADRYFAAAALIARYRSAPVTPKVNGRPVPAKQTIISPEESRLILKILGEQEDWTPNRSAELGAPVELVYQLGLTADDGWTNPRFTGKGDYGKMLRDHYRKWLAKDGQKFVMKQYVR